MKNSNDKNFKAINNYFFFFSIGLSAVWFLLAYFFIEKFDFTTGIILFFVTLIIDALAFYRFNNGIIALARGRFGKPSKKDLHYTEYDFDEELTDDIKNKIDYINRSLLLKKTNSNLCYQIIKCNDFIYFHKINHDISRAKLITDFDLINPSDCAKGDFIIRYVDIKSISYNLLSANYYNPSIRINCNKKRFAFVGLIEKLTDSDVKDFFNPVCKRINIKATSSNMPEKYVQKDRSELIFNIITLFCVTVLPYAASMIHIATSPIVTVYCLVMILSIVAYLVLPIAMPQNFCLEFNKNHNKDKRKNIEFMLVIAAFGSNLALIFRYYNMIPMLIATLIIFLILIFAYKKQLPSMTHKKGNLILTITILLLCAFSLAELVNCSVPIKSTVATYSVIDRYEVNGRGGATYMVTVRINGIERNCSVTDEFYNDNKSLVDVRTTKGLLGAEYCVAEE